MCCIIPSSSGIIPMQVTSSRKNFWRRCRGDIINIYQVPLHKLSSLCIYFICHLPLVFISPTSKTFLQKYKNIFRLPFSCLPLYLLAFIAFMSNTQEQKLKAKI
jgi:hypothetical protein